MPFSLFKKPWDKEPCSFVLQEYGAVGGRGWASITEETETPISKLMAIEHFQPGKSYRVLARYLEGDHAGQIVGAVWHHHEPARGLALKKAEEEKPKKKEEKPKGPDEALIEYADSLEEKLQPIVKLQAVLRDMETIFAPKAPEQTAPIRQSDGEEYTIPPPEFDGKLPVYMHPFVVKTIFGELNAFVDHAADRFGGMFGGAPAAKEQPKAEEEEEPLLPSIKDFAAKSIVKIEEATPTEMKIEDEEEATLPMPQKGEEKVSGGPVPEFEVQPPEESKAETAPSLFSEEPEEEEEKTEVPKLPKERKKK